MAQFLILMAVAGQLLSAVTPLSPQQRDRLASAVDGQDHREDALAALVENARQWSGDIGDAPIRLKPDYAALLDDPAAFRGDLCRVAGRIEQQAKLDPPHESVWEWFIRNDEGRPIVVYVVGLDAPQTYRDGQRVQIDARFYKRIDARARDGTERNYPAFVGAFPRPIMPVAAKSPDGVASLWMVLGPIIAMFILFAGLLLFVRRGPKSQRRVASRLRALSGENLMAEVDDEADLPDDPAEALAALKRRAAGQ